MLPLADLLTRPGPEFALDPRRPLVLIGTIATLGAILCLIWILIKLGKAQGPFHVFLGLISLGFYAYIWGWIAPPELRTRNIVIAWTVFTVIAMSLTPAVPGPSPRPPRPPFPGAPYPTPSWDASPVQQTPAPR
jgi:hypothetical protein